MVNRDLKFRAWNTIVKRYAENITFELLTKTPNTQHHILVYQQFTGFKDKKGVEIYEGDILSDWTKTDEGLLESKMQVFWNEPTGSWHLDNSFKQDKTCSVELWLELNDFEYEVKGNIYETPLLITSCS